MTLKDIKEAYDEARNCGYQGTLIDYIKSVGIDLSILKSNEEKK